MLKLKYIRVAVSLIFATSSVAQAAEDTSQALDMAMSDSNESPVFFDAHPALIFDRSLRDNSPNNQPLPQPSVPTSMPIMLAFERKIYSFESVDAQPEVITQLKDGEMVIEGDKMDVHLDRIYHAEGNASIHENKQSIYGDSMTYDVQNDALAVKGNARIQSEEYEIRGSELDMTLGDSVGEMKNASFNLKNTNNVIGQTLSNTLAPVSSIPVPTQATFTDSLITQNVPESIENRPVITSSRGDAKSIKFDGEDIRRFKDARYTTCDANVDDWYLRANNLEINDFEKSGDATNAWIQFKGVPILYSPWINFSFNNQRKSGLLAPTFGTTSRSGFELLTPFYWNIAPDMDATLGTRVLSRRGLQAQGEFRYMGENYLGTNNLEFLPSDSLSGENRYYARLFHDHRFNNGWSAGYGIEKVSDNQYFSELSTRITVTSRINLAQQAYVNYGNEVWSFNGLVQKYQTLDDVSFPYERLPQLTLTGNKDWQFLSGNLQSQFVAFDINQNASSNLVTGNRFSFYPSISAPLEKPYGFIKPKLGLHYTSYSLDNNTDNFNNINRTVPIFSLDSGLYFDRKMRVVKNTYTQTLEPRMYYLYVPYRNQDNIPIFDTADSDLNLGSIFQENQFTGNDRINNANLLSLALSTRMIDANTGEQRLAATIGQRLYFSDQKVGLPNTTLRTNNSSDLVGAATMRLYNKWNLDAIWQYNTDEANTVRNSIGARYNPEPGKVLNLGYRYTEDRLEQINVSGQWPLGQGWYGMGRWNYSLQEKRPIEGLAGLEYDAGCWQTRAVLQRVETATAEANYAFFVQLELGGIASIGANPLSLLQRGIPGYTSTGLIPESFQQKYYE